MGATSGEQEEEKEEREDEGEEEEEEEDEERSGSIDSGYCLTAYLHLIYPLGDSRAARTKTAKHTRESLISPPHVLNLSPDNSVAAFTRALPRGLRFSI